MNVVRWIPRYVMPVVVASAAVMLLVAAATTDTTAGFTSQIRNSQPSAGSGSIAYTHTYGATSCSSAPSNQIGNGTLIPCSGSIAPTAVPAAGTASATDAISAKGSLPAAKISRQVQAASCAAVKLDNRIDATTPMLARYDTAFAATGGPVSGSGAVTLDGTSDYAAAVTTSNRVVPAGNAITPTSGGGYGVWFKADPSGSGGALFSFTTSATTGGTVDRSLTMSSSGTLTFTFGNTLSTTAGFKDGAWHFAYAHTDYNKLAKNSTVIASAFIEVDGTQRASSGALVVTPTAPNDYWHLGSTASGATFDGSLSNLVVWDGGDAPTSSSAMASATSQSGFETAAATGTPTDSWRLNDSGISTYTGSQPTIGATSPCASVAFAWSFASPASCAWPTPSTTTSCSLSTSSNLASFADGTWRSIAVPAAGGTQTATISVARSTTYNSYVTGLRLYVPLSYRAATSPAGPWSVTLSWTSSSMKVQA